jgi:hypothetical protein
MEGTVTDRLKSERKIEQVCLLSVEGRLVSLYLAISRTSTDSNDPWKDRNATQRTEEEKVGYQGNRFCPTTIRGVLHDPDGRGNCPRDLLKDPGLFRVFSGDFQGQNLTLTLTLTAIKKHQKPSKTLKNSPKSLQKLLP